jgi:hypothetical protein
MGLPYSDSFYEEFYDVINSVWAEETRDRNLSPCRVKVFNLFHVVQTSCEVQPSSYSMGAGRSFPRVKLCRGQECVDVYINCPINLHGVVVNK